MAMEFDETEVTFAVTGDGRKIGTKQSIYQQNNVELLVSFLKR